MQYWVILTLKHYFCSSLWSATRPALAFRIYKDYDHYFTFEIIHKKPLTGKSKPQWTITSNPLGKPVSENKNNEFDGDTEKLKPVCPVRNVKWWSCYGNSMVTHTKKLKNRTAIWSNRPLLVYRFFKNPQEGLKDILACPCLLQHCS